MIVLPVHHHYEKLLCGLLPCAAEMHMLEYKQVFFHIVFYGLVYFPHLGNLVIAFSLSFARFPVRVYRQALPDPVCRQLPVIL